MELSIVAESYRPLPTRVGSDQAALGAGDPPVMKGVGTCEGEGTFQCYEQVVESKLALPSLLGSCKPLLQLARQCYRAPTSVPTPHGGHHLARVPTPTSTLPRTSSGLTHEEVLARQDDPMMRIVVVVSPAEV